MTQVSRRDALIATAAVVGLAFRTVGFVDERRLIIHFQSWDPETPRPEKFWMTMSCGIARFKETMCQFCLDTFDDCHITNITFTDITFQT